MSVRWWLLAAVALFVGYNSFFVIDETERAIVTQFGQYRWTANDPGMYPRLPFLQEVYRMEGRVLTSDTTKDDYLTLDKKKLVADPVTRWRIVDPLMFFKTVRDEARARERLDDIVRGEMRGELSSRNFGEIIGNARAPMMQEVTHRVREKAKEFGMHVVDVRIKRADLPLDVQESVFQRMRAERDRIAKRYRSQGEEEASKIRADADKEVTIILARAYETAQKLRGEGDGESTRIYAEAYGKDTEFYAFIRSLEAYEQALTKDTEMVMSTGNELFQYLNATKP
jgi:membrane protease subunit HflC